MVGAGGIFPQSLLPHHASQVTPLIFTVNCLGEASSSLLLAGPQPPAPNPQLLGTRLGLEDGTLSQGQERRDADTHSGFALWPANALEAARLHKHCGADAGFRHRRE